MSDVFEPLLATSRAMRAMVADKLTARDYWTFLPGIAGMAAVQEIKRRFYRSGPPEDFAEYVFPVDTTGIYGFAFGLKKRLSSVALAAFLRKEPLEHTDARPLTGIDLQQHDVIVLAEPEEAVILIQNFYTWVGLEYEEAK